jgi:hypothetical protein
MKRLLYFVFLTFSFILGQSFTGGIKLYTDYTSYDEASAILDLADTTDSRYGISSEIPGMTQRLGVNLFGSMLGGSASLIIEAENSDWKPLLQNAEQNISRFTFGWKQNKAALILGDYYINESEQFVYGRAIRGIQFSNTIGSKKNPASFNLFGGIFERASGFDEKLPGQYQFYETGGIFRRFGVGGQFDKKWLGSITTRFMTLWAKDDDSSINESTVKPLQNFLAGVELEAEAVPEKLTFGGGFFFTQIDSLPYQTVQEKSVYESINVDPASVLDSLKTVSGSDAAFNVWARYRDEKRSIKLYLYRLGNSYFSAGNPYLQNDRFGANLLTSQQITNELSAHFNADVFRDNVNNSNSYPKTLSVETVPSMKYQDDLFGVSVGYQLQLERSDTLFYGNSVTIVDRLTTGPELDFNLNFDNLSLNYSVFLSNINDKSIVFDDSLYNTSQMLHNFSIFYGTSRISASVGGVFSTYDGGNELSGVESLTLYGNGRFQVLPQSLILETSFSYQDNVVDAIRVVEEIGTYNSINVEGSVEYFFGSSYALKLGMQYISRDFAYTNAIAAEILSTDGLDYTYFRGQEDYTLTRPFAEINILF